MTDRADLAPPAERWLDPAEMKAWLAFLEVSHLLERAIEQQLRQDAGLSHAQYEILSRLGAAAAGQLRMSELADVIVVSRSGLTYQITQLIRRLHRESNYTIVLIEHDMRVVFHLADRICVLDQGRMLAQGTPQEIAANETVQAAYLGNAA